MSPELRWPLALALLAILFGSGLGISFGIAEDRWKGRLQEKLASNPQLAELPPERKSKDGKALQDKSWQYLKRAHLHGGGIAALTVGLILLLNGLPLSSGIKKLAAYSLAVGGLLYPLFWLAAGLEAPSLGTAVAKEKYQVLAWGGALHGAGVLLVFLLLVRPSSWKGKDFNI